MTEMRERVYASVPVSVGTGLALESLVQQPLADYQSMLFNVRTLVRNAAASFELEGEELPTKVELLSALKEDVFQIIEAITALSDEKRFEITFYYPSYKRLPTLFPEAKLKQEDSPSLTPHQRATNTLFKSVITDFMNEHENVIVKTSVGLPRFNGKALVLSHHMVDFVTTRAYSRLNLIESHTGTVKKFEQLNTKLTGGSKLVGMPFNQLTLQVFGDKAVNFYSLSGLLKNALLVIAKDGHWKPDSTLDYCRRTLNALPHSHPHKSRLLAFTDTKGVI